MPVHTYKELLIWQKTHQVAIEISQLIRKLPIDRLSGILSSQIIRSATSSPANIAEGYGRYKSKEYSRFLQISLGSANETDYWLTFLKEIYPSFDSQIDVIISHNLESIKLLSVSLRKLSVHT